MVCNILGSPWGLVHLFTAVAQTMLFLRYFCPNDRCELSHERLEKATFCGPDADKTRAKRLRMPRSHRPITQIEIKKLAPWKKVRALFWFVVSKGERGYHKKG